MAALGDFGREAARTAAFAVGLRSATPAPPALNLRDGASVADDKLIDFVKARLGSYKAPKSIAFVAELALSPVGKVLRRQIKELYWAGRDRRV